MQYVLNLLIIQEHLIFSSLALNFSMDVTHTETFQRHRSDDGTETRESLNFWLNHIYMFMKHLSLV